MSGTCQWPVRNAYTGQLCRSRAYVAPGTGGKAFCPHHIGEARRLGNAYPVPVKREEV